jgi:hypothetical protein
MSAFDSAGKPVYNLNEETRGRLITGLVDVFAEKGAWTA